jgi:PAS domain-containing protein
LSSLADDLRAINERLVISSIREHEVAESAQREKAQLHALLVTLGEGVVIADGTGRVVMVNGAARRILRMSDAADVSRVAARMKTIDLRHVDKTLLSADEHPLTRAMRGETFVDVEMLLCFGDEDVHRLTLSGASTRDGDELALAILVFRDVTGNTLMEQRMAQTERLAALGTLSAGLAHELNNPLAYVVSNVDYAL